MAPGPKEMSPRRSSTGLQENVGSLLAYLLGFITGTVLLLIEKENETIRFHAVQSIFVFGGIFLLTIVLNFVPVLGLLVSILIAPVSFILWLFLMYKAYQGGRYHLPVLGRMAEDQLRKVHK
ncbi:hypothetical protein QRD89_07055 [Halobacillus sp. ACCC02827]|uniref:DUF4870 domain-containing protein n=1 Tax=Bacillaceae TaxID=186817 RepID=UPI0002A4DB97|nr:MULTISPECIES: hypothetical protein [Bacillaceae]ELK46061.1 hypothetical protein D479_12498 [Halobacillus sp. BAB-2008]WJE17103.1 hypothetical protein QRD89_07055 [Halobacillus sp. ACCC02827]